MPFATIVIHFDPSTGKQLETNGLTLTKVGGSAQNKNKSDGTPADPDDPHMPVLWGNSYSLELVEGSNCVVIGGKKYCV